MFLIFRPPYDLEQESASKKPPAFPLSPDEIAHVKARRLRAGASVFIGDGISKRYESFLDSGLKSVTLSLNCVTEKREVRRLLYSAVPENRRWEWLLQKATELGVEEITPVAWERSEARLDFSKQSTARYRRIILEAAGQSLRYRVPDLHAALTLKEIVFAKDIQWIVMHNQFNNPAWNEQTLAKFDRNKDIALAVGPEGGFTDSEINFLLSQGASILCLGDYRLRVETAALAGLSLLL